MSTEENQLALELRNDGAARAAEHADRTIPTWAERATLAVHVYLVREIAQEFTGEDVRVWASEHMGVPEPPDRRAWGAVMMRIAREGKIRRIGYQPHKDPSRHNGISTVWQRVRT